MLTGQFHQAAAGARTFPQLEEISRLLWRAHAEGQIPDADAQAISEAVQGRRSALATTRPSSHPRPLLASRRPAPRSPNRQASLERRRRQATSGIVPSRIASSFTVGELAVLSVIGQQVRRSGVSVLPIDAIAALAGVSRTTVKNAMRQARILGLIHVKERRIPGRKNMTNIVRIISAEWLGWLKLSGGIGVRNTTTTINPSILKVKSGQNQPERAAAKSPIRLFEVAMSGVVPGKEKPPGRH